jgi:hypothetical protein
VVLRALLAPTPADAAGTPHHDVHVQPVGAVSHHAARLIRQAGKVARQHGRRDDGPEAGGCGGHGASQHGRRAEHAVTGRLRAQPWISLHKPVVRSQAADCSSTDLSHTSGGRADVDFDISSPIIPRGLVANGGAGSETVAGDEGGGGELLLLVIGCAHATRAPPPPPPTARAAATTHRTSVTRVCCNVSTGVARRGALPCVAVGPGDGDRAARMNTLPIPPPPPTTPLTAPC